MTPTPRDEIDGLGRVVMVIPTYNAGPEFYWLLRKLQGQQGLEGVEVVVVDSGSSDGTDTLAEEFGCKGIRVENPSELGDGLRAGIASNQPCVIDVATDPEAIAPEAWVPA